MLFLIAWRNVWRSKMRSWTVIGAIAVGLWAGVFVTSFTWGMYEQHIRDVIDYQLAHVQLHTPVFREESTAAAYIPEGIRVAEALRSQYPDARVAARTLVETMLASPAGSTGTLLCGVDPEQEKKISGLPGKMVEGAWFTGKPNEIVVSEKLAGKLHVKLKNKIVATFQAPDGTLVSNAFRIAGIFRTGDSAFDEARCYIAAAELNALLGLDGVCHEIAVRLPDGAELQPVAARLQSAYSDLKVETWLQLAPELRFVIDSLSQYMYIIIVVILLALMFGIVNTMLMAVLERVQEFGMLMAIGLNKARLFSMMLLETVFLALVGAVFGLALAYVTIHWANRSGIDLSFWSKGLASWGFDPVVRPSVESGEYLNIALLAILTALIAAIYPAWKAIRLQPAEAIRKI